MLTPHPPVILHERFTRSCRIYCFHKWRKTFFLGRRYPSGRIRGGEKGLFPGPHPSSATVPPLPEDEGYSLDEGFCDFAFCFAQNDRVGGMLWKVKVFGIDNPTQRKSVAISMDFLMMDCVLVRIVDMWIDYGLMLIGFWLIHVVSIEEKVLIVPIVAVHIKEQVSFSS